MPLPNCCFDTSVLPCPPQANTPLCRCLLPRDSDLRPEQAFRPFSTSPLSLGDRTRPPVFPSSACTERKKTRLDRLGSRHLGLVFLTSHCSIRPSNDNGRRRAIHPSSHSQPTPPVCEETWATPACAIPCGLLLVLPSCWTRPWRTSSVQGNIRQTVSHRLTAADWALLFGFCASSHAIHNHTAAPGIAVCRGHKCVS